MDDSIKEFQKVQILLHEYNTLRAEVLSRYTAQFQSSTVAVGAFVGLMLAASNPNIGFSWIIIILLVATGVLFGAVLFWIDVDIAKAARRLREIETQVNSLASDTLLRWENKYGLGGIVGKHFLPSP
jgi:hypothetical protein